MKRLLRASDPITALNLSARARNGLAKDSFDDEDGIRRTLVKISDLLEYSLEDMLRIPNIGAPTAMEIVEEVCVTTGKRFAKKSHDSGGKPYLRRPRPY